MQTPRILQHLLEVCNLSLYQSCRHQFCTAVPISTVIINLQNRAVDSKEAATKGWLTALCIIPTCSATILLIRSHTVLYGDALYLHVCWRREL